ncbi:unnamed protein product [Lathyrus sativus]|nr:unnamed protein product [Lathyrus sativus]
MGTAILRSHDCLQRQRRYLPNDSLSSSSSPIRSRKNCSPNPNYKSNVNQNRRRNRSPVSAFPAAKQHDRRKSGERTFDNVAPVNLVMGKVKILKRGEKLTPEISYDSGLVVKAMDLKLDQPDLVLGSTDRFGPEPLAMQKQIRVSDSNLKDAIYAGSTIFSSPPPSSVPVPLFLRKNGVATSDLRRLLRLD